MSNPACNNSWSWNFADGPGSTVPNPTKQYKNSGLYDVTLVVANNAGTSETTLRVRVCNNLNNCPAP
jgi:PKD repeat protein